MDTQQILTSLASLRDNLSAIESARQQVQNNVAAYDKVRQQLADTSTDVAKILEDFTALVREIEGYQASISTNVEDATSDILKALKKKADDISGESTHVVESLKVSLASVQTKLKSATDEAIQRIEANTVETDKNLESLLQQTNSQFIASTESTIKSFSKEIETFKKQINDVSEKFDNGLSAQLGRLATSVHDHIGKYDSFNQGLKDRIDELSNHNETLKSILSTLESSIGKKIEDLLPRISSLIDGISSEISGARDEIKSDLDANYQKVKTDLKGSHDATKKRIEKLEEKIASNQAKTLSGIEESSKILQERIEEIKSQNRNLRVLTIAGFVILALPILLMFARMFKFI